ncbi:MAG TPA: PKD domain-containing protein, partial [Solirubrobacteraceae bacterium]
KAIVGTSGQNPYYLQREYSNSGLIQSDPNGPTCSPVVVLDPAFVVPSSVNESDVVEFDGSATASSLIVPGANYAWDFGDGSTGTGPSVVHAYHKAGTYTVMLTVIDRGGNAARLSQTISVLGPKGQVVSPPGGSGAAQPLQVHLQLMPQALKTLLRRGIALRLTANEAADGLATVTILRSAARKARLKVGRSRAVVVGRGTVSGIKDGTVMLHLKLSKATARKLLRLKHLQLSVRLVLVSKAGNRVAVDVAGKY